ncbi:MAG: NfeD family protein [Spirochaetota bacterium]
MKRIILILIISTLITPLLISQENQYDAALIPIEGEIDPFQVVFLRRSIEKARDAGAETLIFSINTFGGRVDTALQIGTLIGSLDELNTVAYIPAEPESVGVSWSAGALISFASNAIYMAPGTSIGAAAPVFQTAEGMQSVDEKTVSAIRTQLAALAEKNGYPTEVALAMVDQDIELTAIETDEGYQFKTRTLTGSDSQETEQPGGVKEGTVLSPAGKLLTLTAGEMQRYGISSGTVANIDELTAELAAESLMRISPSSADKVVHLLTSAAVASLLLTAGLLALYMEISSPGFGIPGTIAITAFALLFLSSGLMGTLSSVELLLFLVGVVLLIVEVFLIPGFGVAGISGLIFMTVGLILSRQEFILPDNAWQMEIFTRNLLLVFGTLAASFLLLGILMMFFPRIRLFQRLILNNPQPEGVGGGLPSQDSNAISAGTEPASTTVLEGSGGQNVPRIGDTGTVLTKLRPVGKIRVGDDSYSVVAEGRWLEPGTRVTVVGIEGNRIVVEEVAE